MGRGETPDLAGERTTVRRLLENLARDFHLLPGEHRQVTTAHLVGAEPEPLTRVLTRSAEAHEVRGRAARRR